MDDNRKRRILKIEELKAETMQDIQRIVESSSDNRKHNIKEQISTIIVNRFAEILKEKEIRFDEEYAEGELHVLVSIIEKGNRRLDDELLARINSLLNRHIEYAVDYLEAEESDMLIKRNEFRVDNELDEDSSQRNKKISNNQIPKIEDYIHNIFTHEMRKLEYRGIYLSQSDIEELKYEILNRLKYRGTEKIADFLNEQNIDLESKIKEKVLEFFKAVDKEVSDKEPQEKKSSNAMMFEHYKIDHELAQKRALQKSEEISLPTDLIL